MLAAWLIAATAVGQLPPVREGAGENARSAATKLGPLFTRNGIDAYDDMPPGVPDADVFWDARSPLVNGADAAETFTLSGANIGSSELPFCPDGSWGDLSTGCNQAKLWPLTSDERYTGGNYANGSGDFSVCALVMKPDTGTSTVAASQTEGTNLTTSTGWYLYSGSTEDCGLSVVNEADTRVFRSGLTSGHGYSLVFCCGTHDADGNMIAYANGEAGGAVGSPGGDTDSSGGDFTIGDMDGTNTASTWFGAISFVAYWDGVVLSAAQIDDLYEWITGIYDPRGHDATHTTTGGKTGCMSDGKILLVSDNFPMAGCEVAEATGNGNPNNCGYHSTSQFSVRNKGSKSLSVYWTLVGTSIVAYSTNTFMHNQLAQGLMTITDDDAAAHEYIHQIVSKDGDYLTVCVWAATESGTGTITVTGQETTGGPCSDPAAVELGEMSITTTMKQECFLMTNADSNCSQVDVALYPVDTDDGVSATGHAAMMVNVIGINAAWDNMPIYIETTTAARSSIGRSDLEYALPAGGTLVDGGADLFGNYQVTGQYTLLSSLNMHGNAGLWAFHDGSMTGGSYVLRQHVPNTALYLQTSEGTIATYDITGAVAGTMIYDKTVMDFDTDRFYVYKDGALEDSDTSTAYATPTGVTTFSMGDDAPNGYGPVEGACHYGWKIARP